MTAMEIMDEILKNPHLICLNVRHSEHNRRMTAATLIMKGNSEWVRGEGETVSDAITSLVNLLNQKGIVLDTRPVNVTTQVVIPGLTRRIPGL